MSLPRNTTAPTMGFGETRPQPRQASSSARRIASSSLSFFKPNRRRGPCARRQDLADDPRGHVRPLGRADGRLDIIARQQRNHPDAEVEHTPHLLSPDLARAHENAEERRPGPAARVHDRLHTGRQYADQVSGTPPPPHPPPPPHAPAPP